MKLCLKIGCFYITRNNPRELLLQIKELKDKIYFANVYIEKHKRKDGFLNLNEWQTKDLKNILEKGKIK